MSTATLDRPARPMNLRPAPPKVRSDDLLVVILEVCFATAGAWVVRLPGGTRRTTLAYQFGREVRPDRPIPPGARTFLVPQWKVDQLRHELNEPE